MLQTIVMVFAVLCLVIGIEGFIVRIISKDDRSVFWLLFEVFILTFAISYLIWYCN